MITSVILLLAALLLVFMAAELFTNALEFIGNRLGVSEGVTGSIFAAIGTAMPETIVPIVAIMAGGSSETINREIGLGAILGAPFMLATLSLGMMAFFAGSKRGWQDVLIPESTGLRRDLMVLMIGLVGMVIAGILPAAWREAHLLIAGGLVLVYFLYLLRTIQAGRVLAADGHITEESEHGLYAARILPKHLASAGAQLILALIVLIEGARMFVSGAEQMSTLLGISAFVVSLLIVPVATELPEKINSIMWIRRRKDTLAFGNITGAMAFQGTMIPAMGMVLMPWHIDFTSHSGIAILLTACGALWLWLLNQRNQLKSVKLLWNAGFYMIFMTYVVMM